MAVLKAARDAWAISIVSEGVRHLVMLHPLAPGIWLDSLKVSEKLFQRFAEHQCHLGKDPPPPSACGHKTGMLTNTGTLGSWGSRHHVVILFQVQASVCAIIAVSTAQIHDWSLQDNCCKIKVLSFAMPNGIIWNKGHLLTDSYSWPISAIILHYLNC